jgi:hypothetical protein
MAAVLPLLMKQRIVVMACRERGDLKETIEGILSLATAWKQSHTEILICGTTVRIAGHCVAVICKELCAEHNYEYCTNSDSYALIQSPVNILGFRFISLSRDPWNIRGIDADIVMCALEDLEHSRPTLDTPLYHLWNEIAEQHGRYSTRKNKLP